MKLILETKKGPVVDVQPLEPLITMTPSGLMKNMESGENEEYWLFRVKVSETQAIVGFPKFGLLGIGFSLEGEDWNVNRPSGMDAETIYDCIKHNKGDKSITKQQCVKAIKIIQKAWEEAKA